MNPKNKNMKSTSIFVGLSAAFIILVAGVSATNFEIRVDDTPFTVKTFNVSGPANLEVRTSGGSIKVAGGNGSKAKVEMYVRKRGRVITQDHDDAKELLEDYEISIKQSGNTIYAVAERENSVSGWFNNDNLSISFIVYVPEETSCRLNTSGGSIDLRSVRGQQDVKTSGGSLHLEEIRGNTEARTSGGSIKIERYAGRLNAHTSGGSIGLSDAQGELRVDTSGGSIDIDNVKGSVEASTSGGGIRADLTTLDKYLRLRTSGGSITAVVPTGLGLDLDLRGDRVNSRLVNFNGEAEKNRIRGSMNGGGIPVEMHTSGGSINLEYR